VNRTRRCVSFGLVLAIASGLSLVRAGRAQQLDLSGDIDATSRFTGPRWSMIRPSRDFEGGCVIGFLAFQFSPTGYFVYNNHVRGSWRVDEIGNLKLRTRDGVVFTLVVDGNTLRPTRTLPFVKRTDLFQRCTT
jgi:hypothetical protein